MKLVIPRVTPSGNEMRRKYRNPHVYQQLRGEWETELFVAFDSMESYQNQKTKAKCRERLRVAVTRFGKKLLDRDNLYSGVKAPLDAMARLGIIRGDSEDDIELIVKQELSKEPHTEIEIEARS